MSRSVHWQAARIIELPVPVLLISKFIKKLSLPTKNFNTVITVAQHENVDLR